MRQLPRPLTALSKRWQDLSIRAKLLVSLALVVLVAIIVIAGGAFAAIRYTFLANARVLHVTRADGAARVVNEAIATIDSALDGARNQITPLVNDYLTSTNDPNLAPEQTSALVYLNTRLLNVLLKSNGLFTEARIVDGSGQQAVRVFRNPASGVYDIVPPAQLVSENTEPFFVQIAQLQPNTAYLTRVDTTRMAGDTSSRADVIFEYGIPLAFKNRRAYLFIRTVVNTPLQTITNSDLAQNNYSIILIDESKQILASNVEGLRYLFNGRAYQFDDPLPARLFSDQPLDFEYDNTVYPGGNDVTQFVTTRPIPVRTIRGAPIWHLLVIQTADAILQSSQLLILTALIPITLTLVLVIAATIFLGSRVTSRLFTITNAARRIAAGDLDVRLPPGGKDEIGQMSQSLNAMVSQAAVLIGTLESRVASRTQEIESTAAISRDLANIRDLNELLQRAVDLLRDRFGFYHVQVFLVDDRREFAVLRSSTGEVGRQLLERNHKLGVGSFSVIGQVTEKERAFITLDTRNSEVPHKFNPLLPNTRSEMALPLRSGQVLIGALDVQSERANAFDDNTIRIFQVLADQLAAAIENTRLITESRTNVETVATLNRRLTRTGWDEYQTDRPATSGFSYNLIDVRALDADSTAEPDGQSAASAEIMVRGERIGTLSAFDDKGTALTPEDRQLVQAVAERVALAIDNVRLVERTQTTLNEIQRLYESSRRLSAAPDLAAVFQIAAEQIGRFEQVSQIGIWRAGPEPVPNPQWMTLAYDWQRGAGPKPITGHHLPTDQFALIRIMRNPKEALTLNAINELKSRGLTFLVFEQNSAQSAILQPLATATRWFGLLVLISQQPNAFGKAFVDFAQSVGDQLAIAIENRQLFDETQTEARRNRALAEAAQISSQIGLDFAEGVTQLLRVGADASSYDRWWFGTIDPSGTTLVQTTAYNPSVVAGPLLSRIDLTTSVLAVAEVARLGTASVVNERSHPNLIGFTPEQADVLGKHLVLPIRVGQGLLGVLMVGRSFESDDFSDADWQLVGTLVTQLSIAAENRRLFAETQTGRETLQSILNSLPAGVVVVDARSRQITLSNRRIADFFGADLSGRVETTTLLPESVNPRSPKFAPYRVLDTNAPVINEEFDIQSSGEETSFVINAVPIYDSAGELLASVAVYTETTELHELEDALAESLLETTALYQSSRAIATQDGQVALVTATLGQIKDNAHAQLLVIAFQNENGVLNAIYRGDISPADTTSLTTIDAAALPFPASFFDEEGEMIVENQLIDALNADPDAPRLRSLAVYRLRTRNRVIGWIAVGNTIDRDFTASDRRYLSGLADQFAVAAESLRLAGETERSLRETEALFLASREINNTSSMLGTAQAVRDLALRFAPDRIDIFAIAGRNQIERINWLVRYEANPPSSRSTLLMENTYISDVDLLAYDAVFVENVDEADDDEQEIIRRLPGHEEVAAQMSLPLHAKEPIGRIVVSFFQPRVFTLAERQFMLTLSEQAVTVMENVMLYQDSQDSLQETATLYQASKAISDADSDQEVLQAIITHALLPSSTRAVLIRLIGYDWHSPDAVVEIAADWSRSDVAVPMLDARFSASQLPIWNELTTPDALWINNTEETDGLSDESLGGFMAFDLVSFAIIPLAVGGKPAGALLLGSDEPHEHTEREIRIFQALGDLIAVAFENRTLLIQAEARARQLQTSTLVGQAATSTLNLQELFDRTVVLIKDSFQYDHAQIFLITDDRKTAQLRASTGEAGRQLLANKHSLPVGSASVIGTVTAGGKPYNVADTADARQIHRPNLYLPNTRSELALPLIARGEIIGALDVQSNIPAAFSTEDIQVLGTLADQIAIAIANARLYEISSRSLAEVRFLFNVTRTAAAVEIDVALTKITREILDQTNSALSVLMLLDDEGRRLISNYTAREGARYVIPFSMPIEQPLIAESAQTLEPRVINSGATGLLYNADDVPNLQSMVLVPFSAGKQFLGLIVVASDSEDAYTEGDASLLQTLASTLTAVIQNARLLTDLQEANQRLRDVDTLKSQFLANMSHELRTPLNSIIGFSRVILKGIDGPLNDTQTQDLSTIYDSGKHLLNLVNDILDQAKIEAGKMELAPEFVHVDDLVKSVMSTAIGLVKDKPIRLHTELQADLSPVFADEFRTRQVLLNIVSNAAKFTKQGSITVAAFSIEDGGQPMVQISVTDTGIGIPRDGLRHVFEPFEQVDNSTARGAEGTGLGMPIAKSLIELMGGRIWLDSEYGVGSTFNITLPHTPPPSYVPETTDETSDSAVEGSLLPDGSAAPLPPELETQVEQALSQAETPRPLQRMIVAVDDEPGMINMYRRYLVKSGMEVIGTTNPEEAGDLIVLYKPSVVLLDVNMPRRNGWEVLQILKDSDDTFEYPVIVCSIDGDRARAFRLGAAEYLNKPFVEDDLLAAIRRVQLERDLPSVLIVNGDPEARARTRAALTAQEDTLRYLEADSAEQALDMIESHRPMLVVFDLRNPGITDINAALKGARVRGGAHQARLIVIPAADIDTDTLIALAAQNVQMEPGLTDDMMRDLVYHQLGIGGNGQRNGSANG